jgi:hypothetical protein
MGERVAVGWMGTAAAPVAGACWTGCQGESGGQRGAGGCDGVWPRVAAAAVWGQWQASAPLARSAKLYSSATRWRLRAAAAAASAHGSRHTRARGWAQQGVHELFLLQQLCTKQKDASGLPPTCNARAPVPPPRCPAGYGRPRRARAHCRGGRARAPRSPGRPRARADALQHRQSSHRRVRHCAGHRACPGSSGEAGTCLLHRNPPLQPGWVAAAPLGGHAGRRLLPSPAPAACACSFCMLCDPAGRGAALPAATVCAGAPCGACFPASLAAPLAPSLTQCAALGLLAHGRVSVCVCVHRRAPDGV